MILAKLIKRFSSLEKVRACVFDLLTKHPKLKCNELTDKSTLKDIGLNSLDIIEFLVDIEEELKVDLLDDEVVSIYTCEEAITIFTKHVDNKYIIK